MLIVLSLIAALVIGGVLALLTGPGVGIGASVVLLATGVVAQRSDGGRRRALGLSLLVLLLVVGTYGSVQTIALLDALDETDGVADAGDPAALGSAEAKISALAGTSAFRLELTEAELQAVVLDGLAAEPGPIRRIDLDLRDGTDDPTGDGQDLSFVAAFKSGGVSARGTAAVTARAGGIEVLLGPLTFGRVRVPALAAGAIQSLLSEVTDLNAALQEQGASVQSVEVRDDLLIITGTRATAETLTSADLLSSIMAQAARGADAVPTPPERIGRGEAAGDVAGDPVVLAMGDSLAAGVGVEDARDGFVSRVHGHLQRTDGVPYGLVNLAVPGETSGSLLSGGQIDAAEAQLASSRAAYVVLDIGANDILGHLTSPECSADLAGGGCQRRIEQSLQSYRGNLSAILDRLQAASGEARVVLLLTYNPFSLGLGESAQERESSAIIQRLNGVAIEEAARRGVTVADGFTPMRDTAAATTHMLDAEPDIHPNAAGHDVLAAAIVDAL